MTGRVAGGGTTGERASPLWLLLPLSATLALVVLVAIAIATSAAPARSPTEEHRPGAPDETPAAYVVARGG